MFLGIDIGTSGVKAVLLTGDGTLTAQATAPLTVSNPQHLWSEQNPADWWAATEAAVLGLPDRGRKAVRAIGLAGQMHGATLLGTDDEPLRPAILWNDGRSYAECLELEEREPSSRKVTGNIAMPGFTAPKLLWVQKHEPDIFAATRQVLLPKDYIRLKMTGEKASDMSDSAGTLWLDVAKRDWCDEMLSAGSLDRSHMPKLYEGPEITGQLRAPVASKWGMAAVPVVAGAGDNAAGAAGIGVISAGEALLSLGTSGVTFVADDTFRPNPQSAVHAFCHCFPGKWHQMAVHLSSASCIDWAARQLGLPGAAELFSLAESVVPGSGPEIFLPYLSGERTPHNDPHIRAAWLDLAHSTEPAYLASAVLEGVAFAHADGLAALRAAGSEIDTLKVIGGGSRSRHWGKILAAALDAQLEYLDGGEIGPALGAARLARFGSTGEDAATIFAAPPVAAAIAPEPVIAQRLAPKLEKFRAAYRALAPLQE